MKKIEILSATIGVGVAAGMIYNSWNGNSSNFEAEFESILEDHVKLSSAEFNSKYERYGVKIYELINEYLLKYTKKITTAIYSDIHATNNNTLRALLNNFKDSDRDLYDKIDELRNIKKRNDEIFDLERKEILNKMDKKGVLIKGLGETHLTCLLKKTIDCPDGLFCLSGALVSHVFIGAKINDDDMKYISEKFSTLAGVNTLLDLIGDNSFSANSYK